MIKSKQMQFLFICLIPIGILILILSIKYVRKTFSGNIILEIPYARKSAEFTLTSPGNYSVWHRGQFFRKAPLDEFRPEIINRSTGLNVRLNSFLFRPNSNNSKIARMELFRFSAPAGEYILQLSEGSSISGVENSFIRLSPVKMVDYDKYFIQIRETRSIFQMLIGIALLTLSGLLIIGGLVIGILSDQIFSHR